MDVIKDVRAVKRCIIVGAGEFCEEFLPIRDGDFVIAADAGLAGLKRLGIVPDLAIGDFDSLSYAPQEVASVVLPVEKDETDMGAALLEGISRGCRYFCLYGCCGGRMDHTISNVQNLARLKRRYHAHGILYGNGQQLQLLAAGESLAFSPGCRGTIGVFAYTPEAQGVCISGLKYSLSDFRMTTDYPIGTSNSFLGEEASISVGEGMLLVAVDRQRHLEKQGIEAVNFVPVKTR